MLSIRFSGATKLLNPQPQSVSCSLYLCVCVGIIHSNGFSNTIYAEREWGKITKHSTCERALRYLATYIGFIANSPTTPSTAIANCPWDCQLGLGAGTHEDTAGGGGSQQARMCSSSLQIKFADKLHLPFAIALSVSISLSSYPPSPLPSLNSYLSVFFFYFPLQFPLKALEGLSAI